MRTLPLAITLLLVPAAAAAQAPPQATAQSSISFEMLHPSLDGDDGVSVLSGAYFVAGRIALRPDLALIAELPVGYFRQSSAISGIGSESSSTIGNPLIGLALNRGTVELGFAARAPLAADDELAWLYAALTDPYRMEAFTPDIASLQATARMQRPAGAATMWGIDLGSVLFVPTDGGEVELALDYGGAIGYPGQLVRATLRLNGRAFVTGGGDLGAMTEHQAGLFADFGSGRLRPGIQLRVPLDEGTRDALKATFGVSLQYLLP
ncbi:MAG TPA: hypothetical protein VK939_03565 [Longimicrobiales bacterium]|nr:hypothetical protein [Longimicrobiales bacterium]